LNFFNLFYVIDYNLKTDYQILIIFGSGILNIPAIKRPFRFSLWQRSSGQAA